MIDFVLNRQYYNNMGTWGELTCEPFRFKCTTFENKPMPSNLVKPTSYQRSIYCIPCGTYDLIQHWEMEGTELVVNLRLSCYGTFARTTFVADRREMKIGNILLTREHGCDGELFALLALRNAIRQAELYNMVPTRGKKGFMRLIVKEAWYYHSIEDVEEENDVDDEIFKAIDFS